MTGFTQNYARVFGGSTGAAGISRENVPNLPDIFDDVLGAFLPTNIYDAFTISEYMMTTTPPFASVTRRVVRYFLTKIGITGASGANKDKYEKFIDKQLRLLDRLGEIGEDLLVYGNSFASLYLPFERMLTCPKCGTRYNARKIDYRFDPRTMTFRGKCYRCGESVTFNRADYPSPDQSRITVRRWNPKRIELRVHPISGHTEYYYRLDEDKLVSHITSGNPIDRFYIDEAPWDFIEACCARIGQTTPLFKFKDDGVYHIKVPALAGIEMYGWGMPPLLPYLKLAYYVQLMRRYDEAIAMDYIIPFRVISPSPISNADGQDVLTMAAMQGFVAAMQAMVERKRKNITDVQIAPYPINYQMLGGEGKQLSPKDSLQQAMNELINALGYPEDMYTGKMTMQTAPVAIRVFEKQYQYMKDGFDGFTDWSLTKIARHLHWDTITGSLQSTTLADDIERKQLMLQAAAAGDISKGTAYRNIADIDYVDEQKKLVTEQSQIQNIQQRAMAAQQAQQLNGGPQGDEEGDAAGVPGGSVGATPGDVWEQARMYAEQLLSMPESQRRGMLIKIKQSNPTLHAQVIQNMNDMRSEARSQGGAMLLQQMQQGG